MKVRIPLVLAVVAALTAIAPAVTAAPTPNGAADCTQFTAATCTGVTGWDGPTGVGVPNGLGAF